MTYSGGRALSHDVTAAILVTEYWYKSVNLFREKLIKHETFSLDIKVILFLIHEMFT